MELYFCYDDVTINDLYDRCLELTIWDYDKITSNDFLGGVRLGLGSGNHYYYYYYYYH